MKPSYIELFEKGELEKKAQKAIKLLENCKICPRECGVNRIKGEKGFCRTGRKAIVASYNPHFGEEAPLVGKNGSGTIFISSCNLLCSFCQNYEISHLMEGVEVEAEQIAYMMLELQNMGCHNINFVTPTHVVPQILEALLIAVKQGLNIPLVYNSGGYDKKETIKLLDGVFDIYMPDFKFWDSKWAKKYMNASDYRERAKEAIKEMHRQVGDLVVNEEGIAVRGLIIRHLVMPNGIAGTEHIMKFIAEEISKNTYVNIMDQYRPCGKAVEDPIINRMITVEEYREAIEFAKKAGLKRLDSKEDRIIRIFKLL
ncbi:MAG: radical SAM protein [Deltaproteobacteria bacterium]|nr:MAG: radical SAM protein [Deltaproteobacteria bacterium]